MYSSTHTDQQILAALAAGDRAVTTQIYNENYPIVSGWLIKNGSSQTDAADLFQEAMVVLYGKAQDKEFKLTSSIGTYLFAISKHLWYKRLQQRGKSPVLLLDNTGTDEDEGGIAWEDEINVHHEREAHYEQLNNALDQIGEPCRSLLKAYYHQDKSMQEIAADFGYTNPENAKNQKYKCLTRLRKLFYTMKT